MSAVTKGSSGEKKRVTDTVRRKRALIKLISGIIILLISVPVFIFYSIFPTLNSQVGPHQIASWIAVTMSFVGFVIVIMAAGELDV